MKPATVAEIIERLQNLPQDLPCYFRPKYFGDVDRTDVVPVNRNGISRMCPDGEPDQVHFLC
jgi:hypothetical protein